jgi:hypothetical protein
MCVLGSLFIHTKVVLTCRDKPLVPENLFDVPDWASIEKHDRRACVSQNVSGYLLNHDGATTYFPE